MQSCYKRSYDKLTRLVNEDIKVGDSVNLNIQRTPTDENMLGRRRNKLDPLMVGPYPVIGIYGETIEIVVEGLPDKVSSDRVRRAP